MLTEKITALDEALKRRHGEMYATLNKGREADSEILAPLGDWYAWRDGQPEETEKLFFDHYRFIPSEEAGRLYVRDTDYSLPLLTDEPGEGYWFSPRRQTVFYNASVFYDRDDLQFASFESFVEYLIELAEIPVADIGEFIEAEEALIRKYTF